MSADNKARRLGDTKSTGKIEIRDDLVGDLGRSHRLIPGFFLIRLLLDHVSLYGLVDAGLSMSPVYRLASVTSQSN